MAENKNNKALPFKVYFFTVVTISLIGLVDAIYLSVSHFKVYTDIDHRSFCAITKTINCDTVSQSPFSIFMNVPIPIWGVLGYLVILFLLISAWRHRLDEKKYIWPTLFFVALIYSINSLLLALISALIIHSHCIMCILSHAANLLLLFYFWLIYRRFEKKGIAKGFIDDLKLYRKNWKLWCCGFLTPIALAITLVMFFPPYWQFEMERLDVSIGRGATEEGYPWIGAENPDLVITEFSDYQCFQCKKMHIFLRQLVAQYKDRLRLVHRHFPMDQEYNPIVSEPFHAGSGKMAIIALYAQEKDQFWEVNDLLFDLAGNKRDFNTATIANQMKDTNSGELVAALKSKYLRLRLKHDIAMGIEKGVKGTPAIVIDGDVYLGTIPKNVMNAILVGE